MSYKVCVSTAVTLLCLSILACGKDASEAVVAGKITYQGKPVTRGAINFLSGGRPLGGPISPDGGYKYRLPARFVQRNYLSSRRNPSRMEGWRSATYGAAHGASEILGPGLFRSKSDR